MDVCPNQHTFAPRFPSCQLRPILMVDESLLVKLTVIPGSLHLEWHLESQILLLDGSDVDMSNCARLADDCSQFDAVDQRFPESDVFDARIVETVNVVPVYIFSISNAL